ncbi:MAG: hypothetical protein C4535_14165, partial [Comamonadaceae bacterium]
MVEDQGTGLPGQHRLGPEHRRAQPRWRGIQGQGRARGACRAGRRRSAAQGPVRRNRAQSLAEPHGIPGAASPVTERTVAEHSGGSGLAQDLEPHAGAAGG